MIKRYLPIRDYAHYKRVIKKLRDKGYKWYNSKNYEDLLPAKYSCNEILDYSFRNEMNFFLIINDEEKTILWSKYKPN